jgi:hypothetical protein
MDIQVNLSDDVLTWASLASENNSTVTTGIACSKM